MLLWVRNKGSFPFSVFCLWRKKKKKRVYLSLDCAENGERFHGPKFKGATGCGQGRDQRWCLQRLWHVSSSYELLCLFNFLYLIALLQNLNLLSLKLWIKFWVAFPFFLFLLWVQFYLFGLHAGSFELQNWIFYHVVRFACLAWFFWTYSCLYLLLFIIIIFLIM